MSGRIQLDRSALRARLLVIALAVGLAAMSHGLAAADDQNSYQVQPGDTLYSISVASGVSVDTLVALNNIDDPDVLVAGQVLKLADPAPTQAMPPSGPQAAPSGPSISYTVQQGDTLFSVAHRNGVTLDALLQANGLTDPDVVFVGQQIVIPKDWTVSASLRGDQTPAVMAAARPSASPTPAPPIAPSRTAPTPRPTATPRRPGAAAPVPPPAAATALTPKVSPRTVQIGQWIGTPNFDPGRPAGAPIAIVIHTAAGTLPGMDNWFATSDSQSSAHFGIGLGGDIHQYVKLEDRSWCDGTLEPDNLWPGPATIQPNELTVNIETEDLGDSHVPVTDAQYDATLRVARAILARYPQIRYLMTHRSLDPGTRAHDPGPRWIDSGRFSALAQDLKLTPIQ